MRYIQAKFLFITIEIIPKVLLVLMIRVYFILGFLSFELDPTFMSRGNEAGVDETRRTGDLRGTSWSPIPSTCGLLGGN